MAKPSVSNIVTALVLLFAGAALANAGQGPVQVVTVRDTLTAQQYGRRINALRLERDGLRSRLEGIETRAPDTIYHVDTLVSLPDTVIRFISVRDGRVSTEVLISAPNAPDSATNFARPELHAGSDISDCDEGFEVSATGVVCDRAVLGHLWIGPDLNTRAPMLSAWWTPSYRSPWDVTIGFTGSEWFLGVRRGVRLF